MTSEDVGGQRQYPGLSSFSLSMQGNTGLFGKGMFTSRTLGVHLPFVDPLHFYRLPLSAHSQTTRSHTTRSHSTLHSLHCSCTHTVSAMGLSIRWVYGPAHLTCRCFSEY